MVRAGRCEPGNPAHVQLDIGTAAAGEEDAKDTPSAAPGAARFRPTIAVQLRIANGAAKLKVLAFNCTLKSARNKEKSSTDTLLISCSMRWQA